jgi:hypothetical protein
VCRGIASILLCATVVAGRAGAHSHDEMPGPQTLDKLGRVSFEISCKPEVHADFNRGVALLHSFWHPAAHEAFERVATADPACAMAYWGEAMTDFHQYLASVSQDDVTRAQAEIAKADAAKETTPRETAYIGALHAFFDDFTHVNTNALYLARAKRYSDAMETLAAAYQDDVEAQIFYALALLNSQPPDDVTLADAHHAVDILNPLLKRFPDHPGIAHYLIHACDNPQMAQDGLAAARRYAEIAPAAPHALHMPAHIYARLGLWQDDIRSNLASKAASEIKTGPAVGAENRLHAMEFLEYAYLQIGHEAEARAIVHEAQTVHPSDIDPRYNDYYPGVAQRYPALLAIETHDWAAAARLKLLNGTYWYIQQPTLLAHAIAAGHLHDAQAGKDVEAAIDAVLPKDEALKPGATAATVSDEIHAWGEFAQGNVDAALSRLRPVADRQAKAGKNEVELPAREMLAEMELMADRPAEALKEYQASLVSDPNRFNGLLGAARAAEKLGQTSVAAGYYRTLLKNCAGASGAALREVKHAREVVAANDAGRA